MEACPKRKHRKRYKEEKPGHSIFGKTSFPVFLHSLWKVLRPFSWVFWFEIFTRHSLLCLLSCGLDLSLKIDLQDLQCIFYSSLPRLKGRFILVWNSLIITTTERKVRFCVKLFDHVHDWKEGPFLCETLWSCPRLKGRSVSVFGKTSFPFLFALGLELITLYSLGVLIWNFYQTFHILFIELWLRFDPESPST